MNHSTSDTPPGAPGAPRWGGPIHRGIRRIVPCTLGVLLALLATLPAQGAAQTGTITGSVTTQGGDPIAGVQILLVGTQRGVVSAADGRFTLPNVPAGERQVRASSIGYRAETQTVQISAGQTATVNFRLTTSAVALDEVVVTGVAGGTERRAIGNVVANIRAADVLEVAPVRDLQSLLNARASNVLITPGTGQVGSGSQIRIRGSSSISLSNTPLLYVDGVRVENAQNSGPVNQAFGSSVISRINDFNPDDIESIEIIKGPAAATLYGTEAANGVIQIITKRGTQGAPQWNLTIRQGANWFRDAENRVPTNYWRSPAGDVLSLNYAQTEAARGAPLWRTGQVQNYNLSLSGGTADFRYHISGNWDQEEGADFDNEVTRKGARANLTVIASPALEITGNIGYTRGNFVLACEGGCGGPTWASYYSTPFHLGTNDPNRVRLEDGTDRRRGARSFPPEYYWLTTSRTQDLGRLTASLQMNHRPTSWFAQRLTFGVDDTRENDQTLTPISALYREWSPTGVGGKDVTRRDIATYTLDYSGSVTLPIQDGLSSQTSFGFQYYNRMLERVSASGADFGLPGLTVIDATGGTRGGSENFVQSVSLGLFVQQQLSWNDRFYLTGAVRADDHSAFGENFELVYYPKISSAWVVSEEPFFSLPGVSDLRLRAAFGMAGEQPGAFDALRTYSLVQGPGGAATVTPSTVGNPDLGPERGQEIEIGFDAGFLNDRAGLEFTWYNQRTKDAILLQPVAPSTGFAGSRYINVGELKNFGFEALLRVQAVERSNLRLETTFSIARNDSEILDLGDQDQISVGFGVTHRVGYPVASWFNRRIVSAEFNAAGQHIRASLQCDDGQGGTTPCYNGNTLVAPAVHLGRSDPLWEGAFSATATLMDRVRLYGLVDFKHDFKKWDAVTRVRCSLFNICLENADPLQFVDSNPAQLAAFQNGDVFGAEYIRDASFLRFREVSASVFVPAAYAQRVGASRATVTISARNLGERTKWTGMDPEARFLGGARGLFGGFEQNHLPQLTSFTTSINLTF
jgi:TonB-linked SusC/RagA family outer membrane protein